MQRHTISDATLNTLSQFVGLELSPERRAALSPILNDMVLPALTALDAVDAGETPPSHSFDPRWKGEL